MTSTQAALCYGEAISANISSTAEATLAGNSSTASITYKWYYSTDGQNTWTYIDTGGTSTSTLATSYLSAIGGLVTNTTVKREVYASIGLSLIHISEPTRPY